MECTLTFSWRGSSRCRSVDSSVGNSDSRGGGGADNIGVGGGSGGANNIGGGGSGDGDSSTTTKIFVYKNTTLVPTDILILKLI